MLNNEKNQQIHRRLERDGKCEKKELFNMIVTKRCSEDKQSKSKYTTGSSCYVYKTESGGVYVLKRLKTLKEIE